VSGRASGVKMVGMVEVGAPKCLDGVVVYPDCWCICLCYLHFAPENAEDDEMYLLVLAHQGYPGHSPESRKMVVVVVVIWLTDGVMFESNMPLYHISCSWENSLAYPADCKVL